MKTIRLGQNATQMRSETLAQLRMVAIFGQLAALGFVNAAFDIVMQFEIALLVIGLWFAVTLAQILLLPRGARLSANLLFVLLVIDMLEMTALLYLSGGIHNLFMFFMVVPVLLAANLLDRNRFWLIGGLAALLFVTLIIFHEPLLIEGNELRLPKMLVVGHMVSLILTTAFLSFFTRRITREALNMTEALAASELALQRELRLASLGGLVAAYAHELGTPLANIRLAAGELMELELAEDAREEAKSIKDEIVKISKILKNMGSIGKDDALIRHVPFVSLVEEAAGPHKDRGKEISIEILSKNNREMPLVLKSAAIIHGLRNIIQNAVDFAESKVNVVIILEREHIVVRIADDGDGFAPDVLAQVGEPYLKSKNTKERPGYKGMGLGVFISKRLLETTGARVLFANKPTREGKGAVVTISWANPDIVVDKAEARKALGDNLGQLQ